MKIKFHLFAIVLVLSLVLGACAPAATQAPAAATQPPAAATQPPAKKAFNIFMMPKVTGNPYFVAANSGADLAAKELGVNLIWQAPSKGDPNEQVQLIQSAIAQKVDAILVSATDKQALVPMMQQAMKAGIFVMTWDADVDVAGRQLFANQASLEGIGRALAQSLGKIMNYEGEYGIASSTTTAPNQTAWIKWMNEEFKDPKYSKMVYTETVYGGDTDEEGYVAAQALLKAHPNLKAIVAPGSTSIASAARAIQDKGLAGKVLLTGLGVPSEMKTYVKSGLCPEFVLWSPPDLGYLSVYIAYSYLTKAITGKEGEKFTAGKLGNYTIGKDGEIILGPGFVFDKNNIDNFSF
jgi:rhamnose transport system substrate-binding protein